MKYYHALYMSDKLRSKRKKILEKIESGKWQLDKYLLVLSAKMNNQLEFYNSVLLLQEAMKQEDLLVVGIADGYDEALELVKQITEEVYERTQGTDIRAYLLERQQEYEKGNV